MPHNLFFVFTTATYTMSGNNDATIFCL